MSMSPLVLELLQFPEIRKLEIPLSEFCLTLGGWDELRILNLEGTSNNKMLLNAEKYQGYSFYLS